MTNYRVVELELKKKLADGKVTREDISTAIEVARALGSDNTRVLYAKIKRQVEAQELMEQETGAE